MYVTMMMTDQIPLELPPLLNGEVAMMPHLVNGEAAQQVILVQVNPGETFTIRAEDGTLQCIQALPSSVSFSSYGTECGNCVADGQCALLRGSVNDTIERDSC